MVESGRESPVHSRNIKELIADLKRQNGNSSNLPTSESSKEMLPPIRQSEGIMKYISSGSATKYSINIGDNKCYNYEHNTDKSQPNIKTYFSVSKHGTDNISNDKVLHVLDILKASTSKIHIEDSRVNESFHKNSVEKVFKKCEEPRKSSCTSSSQEPRAGDYPKQNKRLKLTSDDSCQTYVTDFFHKVDVDDVRSMKSFSSNKENETIHMNLKETKNKNNSLSCSRRVNTKTHNPLGQSLHNSNENRLEISPMANGIKKVCGQEQSDDKKLGNTEASIVSSAQQNKHKNTFDDFCKKVLKTISHRSGANENGLEKKIAIKKSKESLETKDLRLQKAFSMGHIIENKKEIHCKYIDSLPVTDVEIINAKSRLEKTTVTLDDFIADIVKNINKESVENNISLKSKILEGYPFHSSDCIDIKLEDILTGTKNKPHENENKGKSKVISLNENKKDIFTNHQEKEIDCNIADSNNCSKDIDVDCNRDSSKDKEDESESEDFLPHFSKNWVASNTQLDDVARDKYDMRPKSPQSLLNGENSFKSPKLCGYEENRLYLDEGNIGKVVASEQSLTAINPDLFMQNVASPSLLFKDYTCSVNSDQNFSKSQTNAKVNEKSELEEKELSGEEVCMGNRKVEDEGDILEQFFEDFLRKFSRENQSTKRIPKLSKINRIFGKTSCKNDIKRYIRGGLKVYKIKRLKKTNTKTKIVDKVENLNFNDLFEQITQHIVDTEETLPRSKSMGSISTSSSYITDMTKSEILSTGSAELTSPQQRLRKGINELSKDKSLLYHERKWENITEDDRDELKIKIQEIFLKIAEDFVKRKHSCLKYRRQSFDNCVLKGGRLQLKPLGEASMTIIRSTAVRSQKNFKLILYILKKIETLLATNTKLTKRELYYQLKTIVSDQRVVDRIINAISCLLDVGMWALNIIAQKGLVFGNLKLLLSSGEILNCNIPGTLIPQDINEIVEIQALAYFILVVEKESIFYKLIEEGLPERLTRPFIMITGKGFPDLNTQLFLRKLWIVMSIPVFILVDADPHGINIMLNYRFGSLNNAHVSHHLAVPNAKWLGVYPSEVVNLNLTKESLSERELKLVAHLLKTPYVECSPRIVEELQVLLERKYKAEIEGLIKCDTYLSDVYFPNKFFTHNFI